MAIEIELYKMKRNRELQKIEVETKSKQNRKEGNNRESKSVEKNDILY